VPAPQLTQAAETAAPVAGWYLPDKQLVHWALPLAAA
jgi:hypothetical protein